jgi:hypothetical protein
MTMSAESGEEVAVPPDVDELSMYPPSDAARTGMSVRTELSVFLPTRRSIAAVRTT